MKTFEIKLIISKEPIGTEIGIQETSIVEIKYRGLTISNYRDTKTEVRNQIQKVNRAAECLNVTIQRNKHIRQEKSTRTYKAAVRLIMTYIAETRPDTRAIANFIYSVVSNGCVIQ